MRCSCFRGNRGCVVHCAQRSTLDHSSNHRRDIIRPVLLAFLLVNRTAASLLVAILMMDPELDLTKVLLT